MIAQEVNRHIEEMRRGVAPTVTISRGYLRILIETAYKARNSHCPNQATRDLIIALNRMVERGGLDDST